MPPEAAPDTPDQLVASYRMAHDQRDPELLDLLLHDDFRFIKQDGQAWDRSSDYSIMTRMMVGRTGMDGLTIADIDPDRPQVALRVMQTPRRHGTPLRRTG